jgi:hypothetical protein
MQKILLLSLLAGSVLLGEGKLYLSKDGHRVLIHDSSKPEATDESKIEFYSADNRMLCTLDYTSEDGEHGFGVVKAAWTPDSNYFVFSLTSSGGHQAWHAPTLFYNIRDNTLRSLDSYVDAGISKGAFTLKEPNVVLTEVWRDQEPKPIKFRLDSLTGGKRKPQNVLRCAGGKLIKPEI